MKKLAVIISSITAAIVAVVGVVFAGVWGAQNAQIKDNVITVGSPTALTLSGDKFNDTIVPDVGVSEDFSIIIAGDQAVGKTYKLVLNVDENTDETVKTNIDEFSVSAIVTGSSTNDGATAVSDGLVLMTDLTTDNAGEGLEITITFTLNDSEESLALSGKALKFTLSLVEVA